MEQGVTAATLADDGKCVRLSYISLIGRTPILDELETYPFSAPRPTGLMHHSS